MLAGLGAMAGYGAIVLFNAPGRLDGAQIVLVPHGSSGAVAEGLRQAGVIGGVWPFRAAAALTAWQGPIHAAEFSFPAHASLAVILAILRQGRPVQHLLTIPEGLTSARIGLLLARADGLDGAIALPDEGALLPESYAYQRGTPNVALLQRAGRAMAETLEQAWRGRDPGLDLHAPRDLLILASLVERETRLAQERPLVAKVFLNRLWRGMRLQSDPTVVYADSGGDGELDHGLSREALDRPSPYNTYLVPGLPAGPICAPGRAAIEAAAHPARSNALYFVADGKGGHVFAETLPEHVRNVERYRRTQR